MYLFFIQFFFALPSFDMHKKKRRKLNILKRNRKMRGMTYKNLFLLRFFLIYLYIFFIEIYDELMNLLNNNFCVNKQKVIIWVYCSIKCINFKRLYQIVNNNFVRSPEKKFFVHKPTVLRIFHWISLLAYWNMWQLIII